MLEGLTMSALLTASVMEYQCVCELPTCGARRNSLGTYVGG